ncbi:cytochrome P450 4C1-like [Sabethes cyaneus]|uniref:cytochrome P450 4C1-like n=1 Tax=Sabethes cyaneus TaxID=53552 RepID=UPI00237E138D|nr:cytochrome P450 4C1-like [Sabethes cyaneus]
MFIEIILGGFLIYILFGLLFFRKQMKRMANYFPGPKPNPILGNVLEFYDKDIPGIFEAIIDIHKRHGPDIILWTLGNVSVINVCSAKNVEKVVMAKQIQKSMLYSFVEPWLGDGLLISSGEKWFQRRKIITPTFHFKILEQFVTVFNKETDIMVRNLKKHVGGKEFDIYDYVTLMALDSICETSMGTTVNAQMDPCNKYVQNVKRMSVLILLRVVSVLAGFPTLYTLFHPNAYEQRGIIKQLHKFTDSIIKSRRKQLEQEKMKQVNFDMNEENMYSKRKMTFLDLLLNINVDGKPLSDLDIREEVDTFMFEGHDTTTSGISFAIYLLALNQHIQDRVYDEIVTVLGKNQDCPLLTYQILQEFRYLETVVKESMRLYPPVPFIGRKLVDDLEMNGTTIKSGQDFLIPIYVIHRNPEVYPDPEKFDPDRFSDMTESNRGPYDYIPFSAGSRNCIGQRYAMLEMKTTLVKLLSNYKILPGESLRQLRVKTDLVLRPDKGLPVKLVARSSL